MPMSFNLIDGDIDEEKGQKLVNNALIGAAHHDFHPHIDFHKIDLTDIEGTADLLRQKTPAVVINCTVMHTWHLIRQLPDEIEDRYFILAQRESHVIYGQKFQIKTKEVNPAAHPTIDHNRFVLLFSLYCLELTALNSAIILLRAGPHYYSIAVRELSNAVKMCQML